MRLQFEVASPGRDIEAALRAAIDEKTKPPGSLGGLEDLAFRIGLIQQSLQPTLSQPAIVVFAADHGAASSSTGLSAYPQEVTAQMVLNFLAGGAAINAFAQTNGLQLRVVDVGVNFDFNAGGANAALLDCKVALGTDDYLQRAAMSDEQLQRAVNHGAAVVDELAEQACNVVGFGEMGIGNTASAALLMSLLLDLPLRDCVGAGTGLDSDGIVHKTQLLQQARERILNAHGGVPAIPLLLAEAGGFEIAAICGGMLRAAERRMVIIVDGFITGAALLAARAMAPAVLEYCVFSHRSGEAGHRLLLQRLDAVPLLDLGMRLGEGSGAAVAYPLLKAAVAFLNDMASFASAQVSERR